MRKSHRNKNRIVAILTMAVVMGMSVLPYGAVYAEAPSEGNAGVTVDLSAETPVPAESGTIDETEPPAPVGVAEEPIEQKETVIPLDDSSMEGVMDGDADMVLPDDPNLIPVPLEASKGITIQS
jgi:hypothetical protein